MKLAAFSCDRAGGGSCQEPLINFLLDPGRHPRTELKGGREPPGPYQSPHRGLADSRLLSYLRQSNHTHVGCSPLELRNAKPARGHGPAICRGPVPSVRVRFRFDLPVSFVNPLSGLLGGSSASSRLLGFSRPWRGCRLAASRRQGEPRSQGSVQLIASLSRNRCGGRAALSPRKRCRLRRLLVEPHIEELSSEATGLPVQVLQYQLGHSDIQTTLRYVHWVPGYREGDAGAVDLVACLEPDHG